MIKKLSLFKTSSQYQVKDCLTEQLHTALLQQGVEVQLIDLEKTALSRAHAEQVQSFQPDLTCCFDRLERLPDGQFLCDFLQLPHLSLLRAPAFYFTDLTQSRYARLAVQDLSDCRTFLESGFQSVLFSPPAVDKDLFQQPRKEKIYDLVFLGSCYDYESLRMAWRARTPEPINKLLDHAIELFFSNNELTQAEALVHAWNAAGIDPRGVDFTTLFTYLEIYTRGQARVQLLRSITDAELHVFGELSEKNPVGILGWQHYLAGQKNIILHPPLPYRDALSILQQAKIALNCSPYLRCGVHERVMAAYACHALPLTDASSYLNSQFIPGKEILFAAPYETLNARLNALLSSPEQLQACIDQGRQKALQNHTWQSRLSHLLS